MVHKALRTAVTLQKEGLNVEVIDPRTLTPLDKQAIVKSVKKTGRIVVVSEDCRTAGVAAEIAAVVAEEALDYLDAPVKRVCELDTPIPFSPPLEQYVIPNEKRIAKAIKEVM
jgi:pyruvate/2-oxoglutarate/acetoin dehydrogenase E1 component